MSEKLKAKDIIITVVVVILFAVGLLLVLNIYKSEGEKRSASVSDLGEKDPNHIEVDVTLVSIDPNKGDIVARMEFLPKGGYTKDDGTLARDVKLFVNGATGKQETDFPKGKKMNPMEVVVQMYDGLVTDYPFDKHKAYLEMYFVPGKPEKKTAEPGAAKPAEAAPAPTPKPEAAAEEEPKKEEAEKKTEAAAKEVEEDDEIPIGVDFAGSISGFKIEAANVAEYYALLAACGGGMCLFVQANNLMIVFLGLEWFSICLYVLCAIDVELEGSLEAGPQVPDHRQLRLGVPALRLRARVRRDRPDLVREDQCRRRRAGPLARLAAPARAGDAAHGAWMFKASAAPFHMWTPDVYEGAPTPVTAFMAAATKAAALTATYRILTTAFPQEAGACGPGRWPRSRLCVARDRQPRGARAAEPEAPARLLVRRTGGLHADPDRGEQRARRPGAHVLPDPLRGAVARRVRGRRGPGARARRAGHARQAERLRLGAPAARRRRCGSSCSASPGCR